MKNNQRRIAGTKIALFALGSVLIGGAVFAEEISQVTVTASRPTAKVVGFTTRGVPIQEVAVSFKLGYSDLNLATHSGAVALESRINEAARKACKELDKDYPLLAPGGDNCVKMAVDESMAQAHAAIAAAEKKAQGG
jgi:UrcA family protein